MKAKRSLVTAGLSVVLALICLLGVAAFSAAMRDAGGANTPVHAMSADYPTYDSLGKLADRSTVVVRGRVTQINTPERVLPPDAEKLPDFKRAAAGYAVTDVIFRVERVVVGPANLLNSAITVTHLGGDTPQGRYAMEGEPVSQKDRAYVLFLWQAPDGRYTVVDGPQGRYPILDGKLAALTPEAKLLPVAGRLDGLEIAVFERDFERLRSSR